MYSNIQFLLDGFRKHGTLQALAWQGKLLNYQSLLEMTEEKIIWAESQGIGIGTVVALIGDYSFSSVSFMLALIARRAIIVPLTEPSYNSLGAIINEVSPEIIIISGEDDFTIERRQKIAPNKLYKVLIDQSSCGLVLFTSGSTGKPKAVVHNFEKLLEKFKKPRPGMITLNFLLFDHWGGLNTLLGCLASCNLTIFPGSRNPDDILELVERYKIELLPTTPTFLNMILVSRAYKRHNLSSLKLISYGAEPMPASTLERIREVFPKVELRQTYGMIELGVMRAKTKAPDSLWIKIGGEGYQLRIVDGLLQVKAESAMLGYLNSESPFTEDGFFMTGDRVEQDGDYLRILGRDSELINVGGQKVYPAEVETVILELQEVVDVAVYGESHVLTGNIVCADVKVDSYIDKNKLRLRIKKYCASKLQSFMVPVRINFPEYSLHTSRLKRNRRRS